MARFLLSRLLSSTLVILGIIITTFLIERAIPGGPFDTVGDRPLPQEVIDNLNRKYHLDWPVWKQFVSYVIGDELLDPEGSSRGIIRGDFGVSYRDRNQDVSGIIQDSLPISIQLGVLAMLIAMGIGFPAGIIAAIKQNTAVDYSATFLAVLGVSIPSMVLGPALMWLFGIKLHLLPVALWGASPPYILGIFPRHLDDGFWLHALLPAGTLGVGLSAGIARLTRASLLQVIGEDYIRTARAKGMRESLVIYRHALRNSLIPVVTILGPMFAMVLTGTFVVEQVFGIAGIGKYFVLGISDRDYPVIMAVTLIYSVFLIVSNLLVDIIYAWLDPRVEYS